MDVNGGGTLINLASLFCLLPAIMTEFNILFHFRLFVFHFWLMYQFQYPSDDWMANFNWQWKRPLVRIPLVVDLLVCALLQSEQYNKQCRGCRMAAMPSHWKRPLVRIPLVSVVLEV
ncbi:hypothetical protein T01_14244 [Trichinella spiralis]|uniref:Uncharacterized protein n=1 Tax=Trichinella spiralis TaxID=6334 RepID=A0A0V1BDN5_TRISP|nr:hypothetical protein T01_14244 [Trichinella spiralis]